MFTRDPTLQEKTDSQVWHPRCFDVVASLYICSLIVTWVVAVKLFAVGPFVFSAAILVYSMNCVFGDILTEVYGFARTRRLIWMGFCCGLLFIFFTQIAIALPPAAAFKLQDAFAAVHGQTPRIVFASFTAYLCNEFTNSLVIAKMKVSFQANNFPLRAIVSTMASQLVDSFVFFGLAYGTDLSLGLFFNLVLGSWAFRVLYECAFLPLTSALTAKLKAIEGVEHFDRKKLDILTF